MVESLKTVNDLTLPELQSLQHSIKVRREKGQPRTYAAIAEKHGVYPTTVRRVSHRMDIEECIQNGKWLPG